jgi:hypothetical protein
MNLSERSRDKDLFSGEQRSKENTNKIILLDNYNNNIICY